MNIDGVDASVSGIIECPVPAEWANLTVPGEACCDVSSLERLFFTSRVRPGMRHRWPRVHARSLIWRQSSLRTLCSSLAITWSLGPKREMTESHLPQKGVFCQKTFPLW